MCLRTCLLALRAPRSSLLACMRAYMRRTLGVRACVTSPGLKLPSVCWFPLLTCGGACERGGTHDTGRRLLDCARRCCRSPLHVQVCQRLPKDATRAQLRAAIRPRTQQSLTEKAHSLHRARTTGVQVRNCYRASLLIVKRVCEAHARRQQKALG